MIKPTLEDLLAYFEGKLTCKTGQSRIELQRLITLIKTIQKSKEVKLKVAKVS